MKTFVAVFALFLIVGAQPSLQEQVLLRTKWEAAIEQFWTFTTNLVQSTEGLLNKVTSSDLDRELELLITNCLNELNSSASRLQDQLGPYAGRFSADMEEIASQLNYDLNTVRAMLLAYNEEAGLMVKQNMDDMQRMLGLYLRKYRKRLNRDQATIQNKFQEYSDMLRAKKERTLEGFHAMAAPLTSSVSDKVQQHFQNIQQSLAQQAEEVKSKAEALQSHISDSTKLLQNTLRQKMEEIGTWFETEAERIAARFTGIFKFLQWQEGNSKNKEAARENA